MNLAERLKRVRENLGYTQKEMAKAINTNAQTWQIYETGKSVPGGKVLISIARLGFNVNWVLTGEGKMKNEAKTSEEEDTFFQIPFRDALQIDVTRAIIELIPGVDQEAAKKYAFLCLEAMNVLGKGREAVPPIYYTRKIVKLVQGLYDFYESGEDDKDLGVMTSRITKLMDKIATKGKEKADTNEEDMEKILKMVDNIKED